MFHTGDVLNTQILCFIKVAVTLFSDTILASALDNSVTFAGEVLFERKLPTSIKPEATLSERIDLRMSCHTKDEKSETYFLSPA